MLKKIYMSLLIVAHISIAAIYSDDDYKKSNGRGAGLVVITRKT